MSKRFCFIIENNKYYAKMEDSALVEQIASMSPFDREYVRSGGNEYYTTLPKQIKQTAGKEISKVYKNQICFFGAWNAMNIIFSDCDISPYKIIYLGEMEKDISEILNKAGNKIRIRCEYVAE